MEILNLKELCKINIPEGKSGKWYIEKFTVEPGIESTIFNMHAMGRSVPYGTYTRLMYEGSWDNPMMSDTPSEICDHSEAIYKAKELGGDILINGLGLGCILKACLSFPNVTHIDVVEISPDIIKLVSPSYNDPRITIHEADAYTVQWDKGKRWNVAWHDIWANICSDNLPEMARLHRKYGHKVKWQNSWGKALYRRQRG